MRYLIPAIILCVLIGCSQPYTLPDLTQSPGGPDPIFLLDNFDSLEPVPDQGLLPENAFVRIDVVKIDNAAVRSLTSPHTGAFKWRCDIPDNARLETLIGVGPRPDPRMLGSGMAIPIVRFGPWDSDPPEGIIFKLLADGEIVQQQELSRDNLDRWYTFTVDLSEHSGDGVELIFSVEGILSGSSLPYWGHPSIVAPRENPRRVICFGLDTVPAGHIGFMGYNRNTSPNLDRLAAQSTVFNDAHSCSPWTVPAFSAALSGRLPGVTGTDRNNVGISQHEDMIAEVFRRAGFATSSFVNIAHLQEAGFFQGYDHQWEVHDHPAEETLLNAKTWIGQHLDQDFFTFIHLYDPHYPYAPPEEWTSKFRAGDYRGEYRNEWAPAAAMLAEAHLDPALWAGYSDADQRQCVALFDAEIAWMDDAIGDFIDWYKETGLFDDTTIILFSDHGEEFGEHGRWEHGHSHYEEQLHVPFFMKLPGQTRGRRIDGLVGTVDFYPTLLDLFGLESEHEPFGNSLVPVLRGEDPDPDYMVYSESVLWGPELKALVTNEYKYVLNVQSGEEELYNLINDPRETENLVDNSPAIVAELGDRIESYIDETQSGWHLRFLAGPSTGMSIDLEISSTGAIGNPGLLIQKFEGSGPGIMQDSSYTLHFNLEMNPRDSLLLSFTTSPENVPVTFAGTINGMPVGSGIKLGGFNSTLTEIMDALADAGFDLGEIETGDSLELEITDPLIALSFPRYNWLEDRGVYLWSVPRELRSHAGSLTPEQMAELESVGYLFH